VSRCMESNSRRFVLMCPCNCPCTPDTRRWKREIEQALQRWKRATEIAESEPRRAKGIPR
jgi:hypothetical protein